MGRKNAIQAVLLANYASECMVFYSAALKVTRQLKVKRITYYSTFPRFLASRIIPKMSSLLLDKKLPGENAEEPLSHVEDGFNALLPQVSVYTRRHLS